MFEIGASLREARTRQGLDFPEMEIQTKVRAKYLRQLEAEQFDQLPAHTYVKGFLRTYADALGLDGQLYVDEYNSRFVAVEDDAAVRTRRTAPTTTSRARARKRERRESRVVFLAVVAIGVVTALVIAAWRFGGPNGQDVHGLAKPGSGVAVTSAPKTVVSIRAVGGASFVTVRYRRVTGRPLFSGTLERGDVQTFPQRMLWLSITSPKNVAVSVYGKRIQIPRGGDFQLTVPRP